MFFLDNINTVILSVFFIEIFLLVAISVYGNRSKQTFFYGLNIVTILFWLISILFYRNPNLNIDLWYKVLYFSAVWIGMTFFLFLLIYPRDLLNKKYKNLIWLFAVGYAWAGYLVLTTNYFVSGAARTPAGEPIIYFGPYYYIYIALIVIPFALGFLRAIYLMYKENYRGEIRLIFFGYLISSQVGFTTNLILPWIGNFDYNWMGQVATIFWVGTTTYAMLRYNLLNVRLFLTDVIVFILLLLSFIQLLFNFNEGNNFVNASTFIISFIAGIIIIISSRRERDAIEEVKSSNQQLEQTNTRLKTIDERKTEFINIASHQLRTPVTAIKGYVGLMRDGVYGQMDDKVGQQVGRIDELSDQVLRLITDMLNISRIEENRLIYRFEKQNPNTIIHSICKSFEPQTDKKGLTFTYTIAEDDVKCEIDRTLFAQCIENILDNALKYTKREGKIEVKTFTKNKKFYFVCRDNGIGIDKESLNVLFTKFSRSKNAVDAGIDGTGIGMYLAQEIMKAHKGTVTLESDGESKGTTATLSIDL